jgi:hypothetical protein
MDEMSNAYISFVEKSEWIKPLGKTWRSCENNIKMDIKETG